MMSGGQNTQRALAGDTWNKLKPIKSIDYVVSCFKGSFKYDLTPVLYIVYLLLCIQLPLES